MSPSPSCIEHMEHLRELAGYDPNIHGPNARQGRGPVCSPTATAEVGEVRKFLGVLLVGILGGALLWHWLS